MGIKLTKKEKDWILYDVGNSAFTLLVATILPIYFNYLAENAGLSSVDYLAYWGYAASIGTIIVALAGPVLGTMADTRGYKKKLFLSSIIIGVAGCCILGIARGWLIFLIIYIVAKIGFSGSIIFYDSMLSDVTTEDRMDYISSLGYAWGYIGSCIPFALSLIVVLKSDTIGIGMEMAMLISFLIVAAWWLVMSIPLLKGYEQKYYVEKREYAVKDSFVRLGNTFQNIKKEKAVFMFLLAFFFYIDGVYTIIDMATAYGSALGLNSVGLLLAFMVTQIVAFPCAIIFGKLSDRIKTKDLINVCIIAYLGIAIFAIFLKTQPQFWILAVLVGMFQGGIQALSRSYFTKIIPEEKSGEYFGLMDICGKGASFMGTTIVSLVSQITGNINIGVGTIAVFFVVGIILFRKSVALSEGNIKSGINAISSEAV